MYSGSQQRAALGFLVVLYNLLWISEWDSCFPQSPWPSLAQISATKPLFVVLHLLLTCNTKCIEYTKIHQRHCFKFGLHNITTPHKSCLKYRRWKKPYLCFPRESTHGLDLVVLVFSLIRLHKHDFSLGVITWCLGLDLGRCLQSQTTDTVYFQCLAQYLFKTLQRGKMPPQLMSSLVDLICKKSLFSFWVY